MTAGPAYCVVEGCPNARRKDDVICRDHHNKMLCHELTAEEQLRVHEHLQPWRASSAYRMGRR